ncbi:hypothetical protein F4556_006337 [Kitasatospora gansuensis]|uniref:Transcriptional regulator n=1 Tax=Kitasatospora gansuensis TaxID=258050 RepID=A0A7W7WKG5_9ACTN|nr:hypothetical protein [Kitasatospora gansuensis]
MNHEGARRAMVVTYDRSSVAHWLAGTRPREHVCALVCQVLSQALGRTVGPEQAGFAAETRSEASSTAAPHERLRELAENTPSARRALRLLPYSLDPELPEPAPPSGGDRAHSRIGTAHVRTAELLVTLFADADKAFGGARIRPALTAYLSVDIAAQLDCATAPSVGRRFHQAAADLAYLAGFVSFDENLQGAAQSYFRIAAQLSAEANDRLRHAMALRQMSVQAVFLGNSGLALQLAQHAARERGALPTESAAFVTGQEALALACTGERRRALACLGRSQRLLDQTPPDSRVLLGGYHQAAFAHQQAEVLAATGDIPGACAALAHSLRHRPSEEGRARMLTTARLASLQLRQGHLELACHTWDRFLDDYPNVTSARGDAALRELRTGLRVHQQEPAARRVLARAGRLPLPRTERPTVPRSGAAPRRRGAVRIPLPSAAPEAGPSDA